MIAIFAAPSSPREAQPFAGIPSRCSSPESAPPPWHAPQSKDHCCRCPCLDAPAPLLSLRSSRRLPPATPAPAAATRLDCICPFFFYVTHAVEGPRFSYPTCYDKYLRQASNWRAGISRWLWKSRNAKRMASIFWPYAAVWRSVKRAPAFAPPLTIFLPLAPLASSSISNTSPMWTAPASAP